ncbi:MAG TPA: glycosyltransferase family 2 protein [Firmicutes bacterium]|nr:glycosyltransferase family 2 protein [Bacillota bacterium]
MAVAVIIPAFNEERTVGRVIRAARNSPGISQIIVVNDGSTDRTAAIAEKAGAKVIDLSANMGKGAAVATGVEAATAEIILLLDADLVGLRPSHIHALLQPLLQDEADMTVGVFTDGRKVTDLSQRLTPFLSGQRAVKREILEAITDLKSSGFGMEVSLSRFAKQENLRVFYIPLRRISQIMKEEKRGLVRGFAARMKMYWEIVLLLLGVKLPPQ